MFDQELTHNTPTEYRALAKADGKSRGGDSWDFRFDIYGGDDSERGPANCYISIESRRYGAKRCTFTSGRLDLTDMMELYAMLGEAIERAQKTQKAAA